MASGVKLALVTTDPALSSTLKTPKRNQQAIVTGSNLELYYQFQLENCHSGIFWFRHRPLDDRDFNPFIEFISGICALNAIKELTCKRASASLLYRFQ
jgi:hypothetical protein